MKRIIRIFILGVVGIILSSCSNDVAYEKMPVDDFEVNEEICFEKQILDIEGETLIQPEKIASDGENLYICDSGNNRILKCGLDGKATYSIGSLGNGNGEFINPKIISVNDTKLCVYDYGNKRIQLLTKSGEYLKEYSLDKFHTSTYLVDLAIDNNDKIYFSNVAFHDFINEAGIYCIEENDYVQIKKYAAGNLCINTDSNVLYFFSRFEPDSDSNWKSGYCEFGEISDKTFYPKKAISDFYSSVDAVYESGSEYVYNSCMQCIDMFDPNGHYQATVFMEPVVNDYEYVGFCSDFCGNLYLSDKKNNAIYKLSKISEDNNDT